MIFETFPRTNRAFELASRYCSIETILTYYAVWIAQKTGTTHKIDTEKDYESALMANHAMCDEVKEIMDGNDEERKEVIINKLRFYIKDERIENFNICYVGILNDHNEKFPDFKIEPREAISQYSKDGFIITNHFFRCADDLLIKFSPPTDSTFEKSTPKRLKVHLTVEQLTMLFRLLKDCRLINIAPKHDKDIHAFISDNFETSGLEGEVSSPKNIGKLWSSKDPDVLNFWIATFKELSEKAEKK